MGRGRFPIRGLGDPQTPPGAQSGGRRDSPPTEVPKSHRNGSKSGFLPSGGGGGGAPKSCPVLAGGGIPWGSRAGASQSAEFPGFVPVSPKSRWPRWDPGGFGDPTGSRGFGPSLVLLPLPPPHPPKTPGVPKRRLKHLHTSMFRFISKMPSSGNSNVL